MTGFLPVLSYITYLLEKNWTLIHLNFYIIVSRKRHADSKYMVDQQRKLLILRTGG